MFEVERFDHNSPFSLVYFLFFIITCWNGVGGLTLARAGSGTIQATDGEMYASSTVATTNE